MSQFDDLLNNYLRKVEPAGGKLARANDTFYANTVVSESLAWLRDQLGQGSKLTPEGMEFGAGAAAYLLYLAYGSCHRRGFRLGQDTQWGPGVEQPGIALIVERDREGQVDQYVQDFWLDLTRILLFPPSPFPVMHGAAIQLTSLTILTPEYLYLLGTHFLAWPHSAGNWPRGQSIGGTDEDFNQARDLLVQDLHVDLGIDQPNDAVNRLSHWVVWPPYGWQNNDAGQYNLMTLIDQIAHKRIMPINDCTLYLRRLLRAQTYHLRLLAARAMMVLGLPPQTPQETTFLGQSLNASDFKQAFPHLARFAWLVEGRDPQQPVTQDYADQALAFWQSLIDQGPREQWRQDPAINDPLYRQLAELPEEAHAERQQGLSTLRQRHPGNRFVDVALAHYNMKTGRSDLAEPRLKKACRETPGDSVAHFSLVTLLLEQGRFDEARALMLETVQRWPWDPRAVGNAMWSVVSKMVG